MKYFLITILILLAFSNSYASKEGILPISKIVYDSDGIGESGPITILFIKTSKEIVSIEIDAFNKHFKLKEKDLIKLPKLKYNGIQLSYEAGYKETGGRVIYISLFLGFTSGITHKAIISIHENGNVKIEEEK